MLDGGKSFLHHLQPNFFVINAAPVIVYGDDDLIALLTCVNSYVSRAIFARSNALVGLLNPVIK